MKRVRIYHLLTLVPEWQEYVDANLLDITMWVEHIHKQWPCNIDNQTVVACLLLEQIQQNTLTTLRRNMEAERKLINAPSEEYVRLLQEQIESTVSDIRKTTDWQYILVSTPAQLVSKALSRVSAKHFIELSRTDSFSGLDILSFQLSGIQLPVEDRYTHLEKGWWELLGYSIEELLVYGNILGKKAYIDWIKTQMGGSVELNSNLRSDFSAEGKVEIIRRHLSPLGGVNPQGQMIMKVSDYERVVEYTISLVLEGVIPEGIHLIPRLNISTKHIRYTYYLIHMQFFTKRSPYRAKFVDFLHTVFKQFETFDKNTTGSGFSERPLTYEQDFGLNAQIKE